MWLEGCSGWRAIWYSGWRAIVPAGPRADAKTHACTKTHACVTGHRAGPRDACDALPTNFPTGLVWFGLVHGPSPVPPNYLAGRASAPCLPHESSIK